MNRLLGAASILALIVPSVAAAQDHGDKNRGGQHAARPQNSGGGGQHAARPQNSGRPAQGVRPGRPDGERPAARPAVQPTAPIHANRPGRPAAGERPTIQPVPNRRPGTRPPNFRPVQAPAFRYPRGYSYRHWSIGLVLPSIFLTNYYFYNNWAALGAYPPPPGFVWVRYGPDLLLVSRHSGRIRDVIYGAFY